MRKRWGKDWSYFLTVKELEPGDRCGTDWLKGLQKEQASMRLGSLTPSSFQQGGWSTSMQTMLIAALPHGCSDKLHDSGLPGLSSGVGAG